ncbi:probable protein phosphatase CG10417 [Colletes gigas]|uniref:probable protein phosphatase CG10417 n=1 Tax=Colletes gigas TaxID=935657 RepID=UPI001C9AD700|nr:probable protein phosphatase CG10417 [Colletes gigas]
MGAYLTKPITKKVSSDEVGKNVAFGASSMQGWRFRQEDAHNCCIDFDENVSLFAVYDGHGGHEVATYCARKLPDFIKQTDAYKRGDIRQALIDAFLGFDATLVKIQVLYILRKLAENDQHELISESSDEEENINNLDEEENVNNLSMEATMPLEEVMAKYQSESNTIGANLKNETCNKPDCSASPFLLSSSGAGCSSSSSSSSWNTNETDVSSSSQPCVSALSSTMERKESECPGSNEAEQVLDSTTSNGNEPTKSADMPDSSEDVDKKVSSPGKIICAESNANEVEVNGAESKRIGDADSSKSGGDNVSSSSCTPVENGDAGQQERISSTGRRRIQPITLYHTLLKKDTEDSEEDDDDDENDETFDGVPENFSDEDDTEDVDEDESDEDEDEEDEDRDEEDEDGDDNIDDYNDDNDSALLKPPEPGYDSGCTAVVAIMKGNELYVANVGDSRCVLCSNGEAVDLSLDHKPEDEPEKKRIIKAGGKISAGGRINGGLNLSRAIGDHAYKQNVNLPLEEQIISSLPDVRHITIEPGKDEFIVLACDGIWNFMSSQDVIEFISDRLTNNYNNLSKICEELFDHCLAPNTRGDGTGCDNMTAVIVRFIKQTDTVTNNTTAEVCTVKRALSPSVPTEENNDCVTQENATLPCKRPKTEATM